MVNAADWILRSKRVPRRYMSVCVPLSSDESFAEAEQTMVHSLCMRESITVVAHFFAVLLT
jgi:hypothetical protein